MIIPVITTYKPDDGLRARFEPLLEACGAIVVVDNTPGGHKNFDLPEGFHILQNMENLGLGRALNAGLAHARRLGADEVILFDQDSSPSVDFVRAMVASLHKAIAHHGQRTGVGPAHVDDETGTVQASRWQRAKVDKDFEQVTCLATSGMTIPASALGPDDGFSNDFFLDLADFEWCWRLRTRGWTFVRDNSVQMAHRLGVAERHWMGICFHVPAPYRHYFQFRDTLALLPRRYVPIYSKLRLTGVLPLKMLVYPFILDRGGERVGWMLKGIRDALRGIRGIGAAFDRLSR